MGRSHLYKPKVRAGAEQLSVWAGCNTVHVTCVVRNGCNLAERCEIPELESSVDRTSHGLPPIARKGYTGN